MAPFLEVLVPKHAQIAPAVDPLSYGLHPEEPQQ